MLICLRDFEMAVTSALVFNFFSNKMNNFIFHDDGSLTDQLEKRLLSKLPGTRVIRRKTADNLAKVTLKNYPNIRAFREKQIMALKFIDVKIWGEGNRIGYIDSDILFFKYPKEYLDSLKGNININLFNKDISDAYVTNIDNFIKGVDMTPYPAVNAGLWVMNKSDINLDQVERWLGNAFFKPFLNDYRLEQTLVSLLANCSTNGASHFSQSYDVSFEKDLKSSVCKHYVGRIRYGYELEGLHFLLNQLYVS